MENPGSDDTGLRGYPYEMFSRCFDAETFKKIRSNCPSGSSSEKKFCISACGGGGGMARMEEWDDDLYGVTRVVVHGVDSLCVVARTKDLDHVTRQAEQVVDFMCDMILMNALVFEAEDLTLTSGDVSKMTCKVFEKPFVVVSVAPCPNVGHEGSSDEYHVDSAIEFLKEEISSGTTLTLLESVKTAIFTLEHLFDTKFKANEIKVFYVKNYQGRVLGESIRAEPVKEIPMRRKRTIEDHLAVIKKLSSGGSSGSGCP